METIMRQIYVMRFSLLGGIFLVFEQLRLLRKLFLFG